jgi:diguanylate cyclase (GGDEF)-like protein/PAS domain S-box-containing protein
MARWIRRTVAMETGRSGLVVLLAAYLVLVVTVAALIHQYRAGERDALRGRIDTRVAASAQLVADFVEDFQTREATLATDRLTGDIDPRWFRNFIHDQGYDGALVLDSEGRVLVSAPATNAATGLPLAESYAHLRDAVEGRASVSDVIDAVGPRVRAVAFAVPFSTPTGPRVLSVTYRPGETPLTPLLNSVSSLPSHRAYLIDTHGEIIERNAADDPGPDTLAGADPDLAAALANGNAGRADLGGRPSYYVAAGVEGTPWRLAFSAPDEQLFAPLAGRGRWVPWLVLAAFTVTGLLALGISGRYRGYARRLADNEARTRSILVGTPDAFIGVDETARITDWNPAAEELLGWTAAEVIGHPAHEVYVPDHHRERYDRGMAALAAGDLDLPTGVTESELLHRDGHIVPVELVVSVIRWGRGRRMHAFIRDVTPRRRAETQLRTLAGIVAATGDAVLSQTLDGTVMTWNPAAERLYGWRADEIVGRGVELIVPEDRRHELQAWMGSAAAGIAVPAFETVGLRKDGTTVEISLNAAPLVDADGVVIGACASARDITESHRQAAELKEAEERFRLAFDAVPVGMVLTSLAGADRGRILRVNDGFTWMLGYTEEELLQRAFADITHPDDVDAESEMLAPFLAGKQRTIRFEKRYLRGDGSTVWAMVSSAIVEGPDGRPRYAVTQVEDITARRAEQERLQALALADPLTGLANRLLFEDRLAQAVHRAGRHERAIAIVYCDLDDFKPVNDQFGHTVGDELLKQVGHRLMVAMRPSDTVARLGGDEFAVICEDLPNPEAAVAIADRVRTTVEGTYLVSAGAVRIGCSVGVATASGAHIEPRELVARADLSMFSDKRSRRGPEATGDDPAPSRDVEASRQGAPPTS